jgi:NAD(P)-dependent dehydrogenase (short-subunit alcohol dehydrogenase family)
MSLSFRLDGKVALVTGASRGLGAGIADALEEAGATVVGTSREQDSAGRVAERLGSVPVAMDVSDVASVRDGVDRVASELGRLDILVNNAAFQRTHEKLADFTAEEIDRTFRTNIQSMFFLAKAAAAKMKPGSSIINTTSIQADDPSPQLLAYAATKGAIANFTSGLAQLLAPEGIRVNAVAPGPIWTPLIPSTMPGEKAANFGGNTPLGRPGQPAELAPAYVYLASNDATYVVGAVLPVTGGRPML